MSKCSGCGEDSSFVSHTCDLCGNKNHPFCGMPIDEKQGGYVRCGKCPEKNIGSSSFRPPNNTPKALKQTKLFTPARFTDDVVFSGEDSRSGCSSSDSTTEITLTGQASIRSRQKVTYLTDIARVVKFMQILHDAGEKCLSSKAVAEFPAIFTGNQKANLQKASRWWKERTRHLQKRKRSVVTVQCGVKKRMRLKAAVGRGRKRAPWVEWLYSQLLGEFCRLRKTGIKISRGLLLQVASYILASSDCEFTATTKDEKGVQLKDRLTSKWIQHFCGCFDIVSRTQCGKLQCSPEKKEEIERNVAAHLGRLKRDFESGVIHEDAVYNMDEAHFVINMDDKKTLGFRGDKVIRYHDVVSGGEGMTLVIKIRGGASARIETPMIIFQNGNCSYPIRGLQDDVSGVTYRSGPKGWMDQRVFKAWLQDNRCNRRHPYDELQVLYMDNASGHKLDQCKDILDEKCMRIKFLPPNSTHLCQPADSFIIKAIKDMWASEWEKEKLRLTQEELFSTQSRNGQWSGKLQNPGKHFYLELASRCVRAISMKRDKKGVLYPRKAMILCGLSKDLNGIWQESQLSEQLQDIIEKYRDDFEAGFSKETDEVLM